MLAGPVQAQLALTRVSAVTRRGASVSALGGLLGVVEDVLIGCTSVLAGAVNADVAVACAGAVGGRGAGIAAGRGQEVGVRRITR